MSTKGTYNDPDLMAKLTNYQMPFGKHSKTLLIDLPLTYLNWFSRIGFPRGELGELMRVVHDVKSGDMEHLFENIRTLQAYPAPESAAIVKTNSTLVL